MNPFTDFGFKKIFGEEASEPFIGFFKPALVESKNGIYKILVTTGLSAEEIEKL